MLLIDGAARTEPALARLADGIAAASLTFRRVGRLGAALKILPEGPFALILLSPGLPDAPGLEAILSLRAVEPLIPIVVLGTRLSQDTALEALRLGAQDYLVRDWLTGEALVRSCRFALERQRTEHVLRRQAAIDPLTGLPTRGQFLDRLDREILRARRSGLALGVLYIDLDHLKVVNDTLGHTAGDLLLRTAAERLCSTVRASDTVARLGGDEFAVLLPCLTRKEELVPLVEKLRRALAPPVPLAGLAIRVSASIGAAVFPDDAGDARALVDRADEVMYSIKADGGGVRFSAAGLRAQADDEARIAGDLGPALARGEVLLHYQPQYELSTGRVAGLEALLRWEHPRLGLLSGRRIVSAAEYAGLLPAVGAATLRRAFALARSWKEHWSPGVRLAINLAVSQLRDPGALDALFRILAESGLPPDALDLEINEDSLLRSRCGALPQLHAFRARGGRVLIDDFGTGGCPMAGLLSLPVDGLKIDASIVQAVATGPGPAAVARGLIGMGRALGLRVVAEGLELPAQLDFCRSERCDEGQGFLFAPAVPGESVSDLLRQAGGASGAFRRSRVLE